MIGAATLFSLARTLHLLTAGKGGKVKRLPTPTMFISYRREDSADIMGRIYDWLIQSFDERKIFKDVDSIPLGVDFRKYIEDEIRKCEVVVVLVGNQWTSLRDPETQKLRIHDPKDFVRLEVETALRESIPVIPLLVRGANMPEAEELPETMKDFAFCNGMAIRRDPDFANDMNRLIEALAKLKKKRST